MAGAKKPKKPKSKAKAPKALPPTSPKPRVMLRVPLLTGSAPPVAASTVQPTAASPELSDSANLPPPQAPTDEDQDTDMYMPSVSPRQQQINLFWDERTETQDASSHTDGGVESVPKPNEAILHPQSGKLTEKASSVSSAGKRKARTHGSDRPSVPSPVNLDGSEHDAGTDSDSDLSVAVVSQRPQKKARKTQEEQVEIVASDDDLDKPAKIKRGKTSRKVREVDSDNDSSDNDNSSYKNTFVLIVPHAGGTARRVELKSSARYDDALDLIYESVGCLDVNKKPELSYKLSSATAKAIAISLSSEKDWKGFQKEVISQQRTKKRSIPVNIQIPDRYLKSLEAMDPKKSGKARSSTSRSTKNRKTAPLMDLNGDSDDEEQDDGAMEREKQALELLDRALTKCQLCGPGKSCKISKTGDHVNLSYNQRRAWSVALANKQHGVTVSTPPRADILAL